MHFPFLRRLRVLPVVFAASLLAGCSTLSVSTDFDRDADFSSFSTFDWGSESNAAVQSFFDAALRGAVYEKLEAKGFSRDTENPDFLLVSHASIEEIVTGTAVDHWNYHGWGWYGGWAGMGATAISVNSYDRGTLVLDIIDKSRNQLIWRGVAEKAVNDPQATREDLRPIVGKLLADFPPS